MEKTKTTSLIGKSKTVHEFELYNLFQCDFIDVPGVFIGINQGNNTATLIGELLKLSDLNTNETLRQKLLFNGCSIVGVCNTKETDFIINDLFGHQLTIKDVVRLA